MSCETNVCGTGGWKGPQPGDPDNNITLSAREVFGGLLVAWSYPLINAHAVAYTDVYRGTSSNFSTAVLLTHAGGSSYLDRVNPSTETDYYYWVEVVSIHGTRGARIGPVIGTARPLVKQTLETLTGHIDSGLLAQTLKQDINGIYQNQQAIIQEGIDRANNFAALQTALAAVHGEAGQALTYVANEITQRTDADSALATQINALAAGLDDAMAAIVEERTVRVSKDESTADTLLVMKAGLDDANGLIIEERNIRATHDALTAEKFDLMTGRVEDAEASILDVKNLDISPDSALATTLHGLATGVGDATAAVQELDVALTTGTHALAKSVKTVEATLNGNTASGETGLVAEVNKVTGSLDSMFFAKVKSNNLIGGFGIWNNGAEVEAGFDVDTFWIGRTNDNKVKPFIIADDKVFINEAHIRTASIDSLKIKGEAVTIPIVSTVNWSRVGRGEAVWDSINELYMVLDEPGMVYIIISTNQGFINNQRAWALRLYVDDNSVREISGKQPDSGPVLTYVGALPAGTHKIEARWAGHPDVFLGYCDIFAMRVRK